MSESAFIKVAMSSVTSIRKTCEDMKDEIVSVDLDIKERKLFDSTRKDGMLIKFKDWAYPIVIANGEVMYDNFEGGWGDIAKLNRFIRDYTANAAIELAIKEGDAILSDTVENDIRTIDILKLSGKSVRITCTENGAHAEVLGCSGASCLGTLDSLSELGTSTNTLKPEFYEEQQERERLREME